MRINARSVAFGGVLTAASVVIMCMGSIIPVNTYICPVLCILLTRPLLSLFGRRTAVCYYGAVSILSLLLAPDREAAVVYALMGCYPLVKPALDRIRPRAFAVGVKALLFTAVGVAVSLIMMAIMGADAWTASMAEAGLLISGLSAVMWLLLFFLVDRLLGMKPRKRK